MGHYDLTDAEWKAIEPHLPNKVRGVKRVEVSLTSSAPGGDALQSALTPCGHPCAEACFAWRAP